MRKTIEYKDFPVFNYWNFNKKEFEPRSLNNLSIKFNDYVYDREYEFINCLEEELVDKIIEVIINAVKYSMFGNSSYEAHYHDDSHGGGLGSIQQQFVCWALDINESQYNRGLGYSDNLYTSYVLRDWVYKSDLYMDILKDRDMK